MRKTDYDLHTSEIHRVIRLASTTNDNGRLPFRSKLNKSINENSANYVNKTLKKLGNVRWVS